MRNLVVCCDGTWNAPDNKDDGKLAPTNIFKIFNAVETETPPGQLEQLTRYQSGVGTGGLVDKIKGGLVGFGVSEDIRDCYQWLSLKYQPGDRIWLFGFSRGAFTARSLAGMIDMFGLADLSDVSDYEAVVGTIYGKGYRDPDNADEHLNDIAFHPDSRAVHFIGAFDTVGALGVPDDKSLLNIFDNPAKHRFHSTTLGDHVHCARHALAIDEKRGSFAPTLWDQTTHADRVIQQWFPGVHSDVGGGYQEKGLSDCALAWMLNEAQQEGLVCKGSALEQIAPDPLDVKHESHTGFMKALVTAPRNFPNLEGAQQFNEAVNARRKKPPIDEFTYLPTILLSPNTPVSKDIYAKHPWNWTGMYLEQGKTYDLSATGQWVDRNIKCGPGGTNDGNFHLGELVQMAGSLLGTVEKFFKSLGMSDESDFLGTKREEDYPWFALVGAIANQANPDIDGTPPPPEVFLIGDQKTYTPAKSGYLYCFANDAWGFYGNNRGFVTLTVNAI